MVVEKGRTPLSRRPKSQSCLMDREAASGCKIGGSWRLSEHILGNVWVKPIGGKYDEGYTTTAKKIRVLNLHLTASVFTQLGDCYGLPAALDRSVRYVCGEQDEVVNQIGLSVLSEMMTPMAAGRMFAETASLLLAARLLHAHWDAGSVRLPSILLTISRLPISPTSRLSASFTSRARFLPQ
jgi:AraC family transcriptional regulator